jgi:hypothetical protein
MKRLIKKALALFAKPKEEVKVEPQAEQAWPFPVEAPKAKRKPRVAKATTRPVKKPAAKKTVKKKAK